MSTEQINIYDYNVLDNFAEKLLSHLGLDNVTAVDISSIAKKLGLNVYSASFENNDISGYIKYENGEKNIYVNNSQSVLRQRFTIAHEIAHFILHQDLLTKKGGTPMFRGGNFNPAERQANRLAAALLMPKSKVTQMYQSHKSINDMAQLFWVSYDAMANRISSLGL